MALQTEDASTVLEQFIQDVANLPAEIAHLLEEVQAKDELLSQCRTKINELDVALQKHVKLKGALVKHDREDAILQTVGAQFDRAQALQDEKVALSNKAAFLLDRHVKRLDLKIRDLQTEGAMNVDPSLPSLLHESHANRVGISSASNTGTSTPVHPLAHSSGSSTNVANAAMAQMLNRVAHQNNMGTSAPAAAMQPHPMLNNNGTNGTQRRRDVSTGGSSDTKRRRLNATIPVPNAAASMQQRHSSLGPGTPKAGTPAASRAGSAGPRTKKATKKVPPHVQSSMRKKQGKIGLSKSGARRLVSTKKGTPSSTGEDESAGDNSGSDDDQSSAAAGKDGAADEDDMDVVVQDDDADDSKLYCFCKSVSHGDMVACDNEDCPHEWFHWVCVGLTQEPKGRWLCDHCRKLPQGRIKLAR